MAGPAQAKSRHLRVILYRLKQNWGIPCDFYQVAAGAADFDTGAKNVTLTKLALQKLVVLPEKHQWRFEYDLAFIAANKNFTYGGLFMAGDRQAMLDARDVAGDFKVGMNDYLVFEGCRWNILRWSKVAFDVGYFFHLRRSQGDKGYQQLSPPLMYDRLTPTSTFGGVVA